MWERSMSSRIVPESIAGIIPQRPEAGKSIRQTDLQLGIKKPSQGLGFVVVNRAERAGFEPAEAFTSLVFKTRAINHSTTSPEGQCGIVAPRTHLN